MLDERVNASRANFKRYEEAFSSIKGVEFQPELKGAYSNRLLTALTIDPEVTGITRTEIIEKLEESNIEARPVWKPMYLQPLFEEYYSHEEDNSVSYALFEKGLCLPSGTIEQQEKVIEIVKEVFCLIIFINKRQII